MYRIALLSDTTAQDVVPSLSLLSHRVQLFPLDTAHKVLEDQGLDLVIVDAPSEMDARLRLAIVSEAEPQDDSTQERIIRAGNLVIDTQAYSAHLSGAALNLTFKEFELLKFMAMHPGRVFSRAQLLSEVWGYDSYYGGTRTVDVHVRRLRSKLGTEHEQMISTVRNVGYSFSSTR